MSNQIKDVNKARELIDKIPYLKDYDRKDKDTLASLSFFREYSQGEVIIEQDAPNQELFFLIRGKVDILVQGNHVVSLRGGGRIFGEMSFVNHSFTSASVVANTDLVMMVYKIPGLLSLSVEKHASLKVNLYKSIAEMLAQKLKDTTDLAQSYKKLADRASEDL
jgi:CRP-like cAMP-binding protein